MIASESYNKYFGAQIDSKLKQTLDETWSQNI